MFIPKKYGQSKVDKCPFCQKQATSMNKQNVPVCLSHKDEFLDNLECVCGSTLEMLNGNYGIFFSCMKCGSINLKKVLDMNAIKPKSNSGKTYSINKKNEGKTITVRSDDPRYFD